MKDVLILVFLFLWISTNFSCFGGDVSFFQTLSGQPRVFKKFPIKWKFDCDFPPELEEPVKNSIDYWQKFAKVKLLEEVSDCHWSDLFSKDSGGGLVFVSSKNSEFEFQDGEYVELWGRAPMATYNDEPFAGAIVLYKRWQNTTSDGLRESVVRHELGHFFGFQHTERQDCLMYRSINNDEEYKNLCCPEIKLFKDYY